MALGPGPGGGGGIVTPGLQAYSGYAGGGASAPSTGMSDWDKLALIFSANVKDEFSAYSRPYTGDWKDTAAGENRWRSDMRKQQQDRRRLRQKAREAGVNVDDPVALAQFWANAVKDGQAASVLMPNKTPEEVVWKVIDGYAKEGAPGTLKYEATQRQREEDYFSTNPPDPYSVTNTSKNIQITDPDTARALVTEYLEQRIGRRPKDSEIKDFVSALNKKERANPTVTTTVERYGYDKDAGQMRQLSSSSTTEGGPPSPTAFAANYTEDEHEGEERAYRAGVQYSGVLDALFA